MKYAMTVNNVVIEICEADTPPVWGNTPRREKVIAIPCDDTVVRDMVYNTETKEFYALKRERVQSDAEKIQDSQLSIMEAMADQYEQQQEVNLNVYDVLATIYETVSGGAE